MSAETGVEEIRQDIANRLGEPERLTFPEDWELSSSWRRAQIAPSQVGAANPAEFDVLMGYVDEDGLAKHRVLFTLYRGQLRAECPCEGYSYRGWCAHVALLWWKWSREQLGVTDLDTGRNHLSPPWWFDIEGAEAQTKLPTEGDRPAVTDGGKR